MFAAGYDIHSKEGWNSTVDLFDAHVGLKYLRGMHLNDSKTECGSKKDRHDNIGAGHLSIQAFAHILVAPRMQDIPLVLETPSHEETSKNWNVCAKEIEVLYALSSLSPDPSPFVEQGITLAQSSQLDLLAQEIRDAIKTAGGGNIAGKAGKAKVDNGARKGLKKKGEKEEKEAKHNKMYSLEM